MKKRGRTKKIGEFAKGSVERVRSVLQQNPHPIDVHVGKKLRVRRILMGISQEQLGEAVGLTFQQIQKYERGANRVSSSRLWEFSQLLGVEVAWFFQNEEEIKSKVLQLAEEQEEFSNSSEVLTQKETLSLVKAWYGIKDKKTREKTLDLIKSLGQ
ncbi:MAG: helix-turn-helix domain-containing protein [Alphaproteobacteria bacterium]